MQAQKMVGATFCTTSGLLTAAGAVTTHDTTVTISYAINGKARTKTAITGGTTPTTDYNTGAAFPVLVGGASVAGAYGHGCTVIWALDASGNVKCMMGKHQALDSAGNFLVPSQFPSIPNDVCPFAYQILKAGATAAVNIAFGTSNWNATGFTNVIQDILCIPDRPQVS